MFIYAILLNPGHNRVYFNSSVKLSVNELYYCQKKLSAGISDIRIKTLGGVNYILFDTEKELSGQDFVLLSRLSFVLAIFELADDGRLTPREVSPSYFFPDDLGMILKYSGKTNELFTRMMINVAVMNSGFSFSDTLNVLDPVCGKGTTLFESLILGYNAYGVELSEKYVDETVTFIKRYLTQGHYKHKTRSESVGIKAPDSGAPSKARRFFCELSKNKQDQKENIALNFEITSADTVNTAMFYKKNTFHIIAGDLPYGVQHNNSSKGNSMRNPSDLLEAAVPVWVSLLKVEGVLALSWNTFLLKREKIEEIFEGNGLVLLDSCGYSDFSHRVDQAINRDLIIGIRR